MSARAIMTRHRSSAVSCSTGTAGRVKPANSSSSAARSVTAAPGRPTDAASTLSVTGSDVSSGNRGETSPRPAR